MGQREENHVVPREGFGGRRLDAAVGQWGEMRVDLAELTTGGGVGREGRQGQCRMPEQQTDEFAAGIPAGPGDRDADHGA